MRAKNLVISAIALWTLATAAGYMAHVEWGIIWLPAALKATGHICTWLALGLGLYGLYLLLWPFLKALFQPPQQPALAEAPEISGAIRNLAQILAEVERDSSKASLLLLDAQTYAGHLVRLIQGITLKAEAMVTETEQLSQALAAIASRDPLQIAQAAGSVQDGHIRSLMLCKVKDPGYWQDVAILVSAQLGTLEQWIAGYRTFTSNLLGEVSRAKSQLAASTAALELVGAARPLLQVQDNLEQAASYLQLQRKPGLAEAARSLPAINAGLLK